MTCRIDLKRDINSLHRLSFRLSFSLSSYVDGPAVGHALYQVYGGTRTCLAGFMHLPTSCMPMMPPVVICCIVMDGVTYSIDSGREGDHRIANAGLVRAVLNDHHTPRAKRVVAIETQFLLLAGI